MKVLITGATGFVGGHLAGTLAESGHEVRALARSSSDVSRLKKLGVEIADGDITDSVAVEKAARGCQQIYHLAAKTSRAKLPWKLMYEVNVKGTETVARAAVKADVGRLIYVSSCGIYGTVASPPVDENTKPNPNSFYRESKLLGEEVVLASHKKDGLPVVIARITSVVGPRSLSWLGLFQAIATKRFRIVGAGENHSHISYISDIVDGIRRCGETSGIEGETYLIAGPEPKKITQLVGMIAQELGIDSPHGKVPGLPFRAFNSLAHSVRRRFGFELPYSHRYELFLTNSIFNTSKAQKELGYCPKIPVREAVRQTAEWYREKGYI